MTSRLEQLRQYTTVVADTGDLDVIARLKLMDATTNPPLLLRATALPHCAKYLRQTTTSNDGNARLACDRFAVIIDKDILGVIPGRISAGVDVRLSSGSEATPAHTHRLIELYDKQGINRERALIRIASA